jgi:hypothetical protein
MLQSSVSQPVPGSGSVEALPQAAARESLPAEARTLIPGKYYHLTFIVPTKPEPEALILCLSSKGDEYTIKPFAIRNSIQSSYPSDILSIISDQTLAQLPSIEEVPPTDLPLYVGWDYVSPQFTDLLKNSLV